LTVELSVGRKAVTTADNVAKCAANHIYADL
jgi:hypothetical protein